MEGIRDGRAVDDCYHCALVYTLRADEVCPRCGGRMRYEPAALVDAVAARARRTAAIAAYRATPSPRTLETLLVTLHRDEAVDSVSLAEDGLSRDALRAAYESFGGSRTRLLEPSPTAR